MLEKGLVQGSDDPELDHLTHSTNKVQSKVQQIG